MPGELYPVPGELWQDPGTTQGNVTPEHHHYSSELFLCFSGHCELPKLPKSITPAPGLCAGPASPPVLGADLGATISDRPKQEKTQRRDVRMGKGLEVPHEEQLL